MKTDNKGIQKKQAEVVNPISVEEVRDRIIILRDQPVLLDSDVAELYGVQTKEINQAVKNNPKKFPYGYIMVVDEYEKAELVKNGTFKIMVVKREAGWQVRMAGLPRSGKQSRD